MPTALVGSDAQHQPRPSRVLLAVAAGLWLWCVPTPAHGSGPGAKTAAPTATAESDAAPTPQTKPESKPESEPESKPESKEAPAPGAQTPIPPVPRRDQVGTRPVPPPPRRSGQVAQPTPDPTSPLESPPPGEPPTSPAEDEEAAAPAPVLAPVLEKRRLVPPIWFDYTYDTHRTRGLGLPPLFVDRRPRPGHEDRRSFFHADLSLTFGWDSKTTDKRRWINPAGLFFGSFSPRKTVWGAVPLLMGYKRVGQQFNFGQFPLVWWWGNKHVRNLAVLPLHYHQRAPEGFTGISGLLFWYGHKNLGDNDPLNDKKHFVAAPVFYQFTRGMRSWNISPLYFGGRNKLKGLKYSALVPFYLWQSREFGNRKELWTLLVIRRSDLARRKKAWAVPPLLTFRHRGPQRSLFSATPLFWRGKNKLTGGTTTVAGPLVRYVDPAQRNHVLFPLWWQFRDLENQVTTAVVPPLAVARRSPDRTAVWTLLGGGMRDKDGSWGLGVPPLLTFVRKEADGRSLAGALGLLWHVHDREAGRRRVVVGPLAYASTDREGFRLGLPPLLSFIGRNGTRRHQVITPMFWHVRDDDPDNFKDTWAVPPLYLKRTREGFHVGLPPLAFMGQTQSRNYGILPPLLTGHVADRTTGTTTTISPLFVRSRGKNHQTLGVAWLGWDVKRPGERHTVAVPLYYRRQKGDTTLHLTPLGGGLRRGERRTWVAGPFYRVSGPNRNGFGLLPLAYWDRRPVPGGTASHAVLAPLFAQRRTPTDDLDMYTPLVWRTKVRGERPRQGLAVVPLYFRQRQPSGVDVDAGAGFFYSRNARRRTHVLIAGPYYRRLSRRKLHTGVAPIYWWMDSEQRRRLISLPMIFHLEDKLKRTHTTMAPPFWFDRRRANGRRTWAAFPFAFGGRRLHNFTRFSLAPPGYVDLFRIRKNHRFVGFVPLLWRYQKCGFQATDEPRCQYTVWGSFPLFLYGQDGQGRKTHGALALYYFDKRPDRTRLFTPVFGVNYSPGQTLGWYALTAGAKTTPTHKRSMFLPFFFHKRHRTQDESTTLLLPPLYIGRHKKDRRWFQAAGLVWQFRQQHKVSTAVVPPIFFYQHSYAERKLSWVLPLYLRDNNVGKDQALTALFPLLYVQRRRGANLDVVQFPLVWHLERGENQGTFGALLWWDIRVKSKVFQMVPAIYTRFKGPTGDTRVVGPLLGWWTHGVGRTEGDFHWRALLGLFGAGVENGVKYTAILGAKIPRDPAVRKANREARQATRRSRRLVRRGDRKTRRLARQGARTARHLASQPPAEGGLAWTGRSSSSPALRGELTLGQLSGSDAAGSSNPASSGATSEPPLR